MATQNRRDRIARAQLITKLVDQNINPESNLGLQKQPSKLPCAGGLTLVLATNQGIAPEFKY